MDHEALALLRLQIEWGADEALLETPLDRLAAPSARPSLSPSAASLAPAAPTAGPVPALARAEQIAAAAATLDDLRAALEGFDGCALRDTAGHLVFADGDPASALMLIGDVPGREEDETGRPFAGPAGRLLERMLGSIGLARDGVRIAMLLPWRPPGGRPPTPGEIALCLPFLLRHIALAAPRRLVLLGALPARALLGGTGRKAPRAGWAELVVPGLAAPLAALLMASPAAALTSPAARREAWAALRLLRRALDADPG